MLDARHNHPFLDAVEQRELEAVGGFADFLRLDNSAHAKVNLRESVNVDFRLDIRHRVGIAIHLGGRFFDFLHRRLVQRGFLLGLGIREIQQLHIAFGVDGIEEEIQARTLFTIDKQLVDALEERALKLFEFLVSDGGHIVHPLGDIVQLGIEFIE